MPRRFPWSTYSDERLLQMRLKDLKVTVEGTWLEDCLDELYEELEHRHIAIKPHVWLSDEWFAPENTPGIAIPFYLAHPRLSRLEKSKMFVVEGGTEQECMRILRHEAGHAIQHAYGLHRRRRWQKLFGPSSQRYPKFYRPNPASKNFVQHLPLWYGQSHPDEDFAETFAVWMRPRSAWRTRYAGWGALKKLEYVDELMAEIADEKPKLTRKFKVDPLSTLNYTVREYYDKKQALYTVEYPKTYDKELHRIFSADPKHYRSPPASQFLRRNRAKIRQMVAKWTGEHQLTLDAVIDNMIGRCRELKLRAVGPERQLAMDFTLLLTAKAVHSLYSPSRREWFAL